MSEHTILHQDDVEDVIDAEVTAVVQDVVDAVVLEEVMAALTPVTSTTTNLTNVAHAINTSAAKVAGQIVFNTTTGALVVAVGANDNSVWNTAAGALAHTPV